MTPFGKDPMKALSAACAKRDIGFGFYYSQDQDWHEANGRGNDWDFPKERQPRVYLENKVMPQVKEILGGYGRLSLIWFDTPGMLPATLNDTWDSRRTIQNWKDPGDLIAKLADIVSKGGNYLLNVGPAAEGVIPEASRRILRTIGKWIVNGESIYGAGRSPFYFPDITWRATAKPGKVYLHIARPGNARLALNANQVPFGLIRPLSRSPRLCTLKFVLTSPLLRRNIVKA
ncbi:MAG: alpha-L-fucosidase [Bryobacteraceae bacterium]